MQKSLNHIESPEAITIRVAQIEQMDPAQREAVIRCLNHYGCALLGIQGSLPPERELGALTALLGQTILHDRSSTNGISTITPCAEDTGYAALTYNEHLPHTDCSYQPVPPAFVALQCEIPARCGGTSILIPAEALHQYLAEQDPEGLRLMYDPDAYTIQRKQQVYTCAIFRQGEQGRIQIAYKVDAAEGAFSLRPKPALQGTLKRVNQFLLTPQNQFRLKLEAGQILLFDNTRVLHGRTAIEVTPGDPDRKLHRLWFNGGSIYQDRFELGFYPNQGAVAEQAA